MATADNTTQKDKKAADRQVFHGSSIGVNTGGMPADRTQATQGIGGGRVAGRGGGRKFIYALPADTKPRTFHHRSRGGKKVVERGSA